jgi:hypothetical protein
VVGESDCFDYLLVVHIVNYFKMSYEPKESRSINTSGERLINEEEHLLFATGKFDSITHIENNVGPKELNRTTHSD